MHFEIPIAFAVFSASCTWALCNYINRQYGKGAITALALAIVSISVVFVLIGAATAGPFAIFGAMILAAAVCLPAFLTSVLCAIFMSEP
jgi:hypothetical protein